MTPTPAKPIPIQILEANNPNIEADAEKFSYTCKACGDVLQLDALVLTRLMQEGAHRMVLHIGITQVAPWILSHKHCQPGTESFSV